MAQPDIGNGRVRASLADKMDLKFTSAKGAVIALHYELLRVATPPVLVEERDWNDLDFIKTNPRGRDLSAANAPGRYRIVIVPVLQSPSTTLKVELLKAGVVVYRRTAVAGTPVLDAIQSIALTRT
ncbi:MAG: hypothetical protein SGI99_00440 [Pseudomonadota bacterium]|nr:hypothetical protein [Pseudomonadota bacterium]